MNKRDQDLQRYFDDEMAPDERARFEAELTPQDREILEALDGGRRAVSNTLMAEAADIDLWPALEAKLPPSTTKKRQPRGDSFFRRFGAQISGGLMIAAAAAFVLLSGPSAQATNNCDVESLEVSGAVATVMTLHDHSNDDDDNAVTLIWQNDASSDDEAD